MSQGVNETTLKAIRKSILGDRLYNKCNLEGITSKYDSSEFGGNLKGVSELELENRLIELQSEGSNIKSVEQIVNLCELRSSYLINSKIYEDLKLNNKDSLNIDKTYNNLIKQDRIEAENVAISMCTIL
jgi:hypothetical protein